MVNSVVDRQRTNLSLYKMKRHLCNYTPATVAVQYNRKASAFSKPHRNPINTAGVDLALMMIPPPGLVNLVKAAGFNVRPFLSYQVSMDESVATEDIWFGGVSVSRSF